METDMGADGAALQEGDEMSKSIMEPRGGYECYNCGDTRNIEEHHIFYGCRNRKLSEHYGLKVHLCPGCHRNLKTGVHGGNLELDKRLKAAAQELFEAKYGHDFFMRTFGKNYLDSRSKPEKTEENGFQWI